MDRRTFCALGAIGLGCLTAGCQQYTARPLDPERHRSAWRDRSPADDEVVTFAHRLVRADDHLVNMSPDDGISLAEAEIIALVYNADLRIARLRLDVAAATAGVTGQWDDPEFGLTVLRVTESVPDHWIITPQLTLTIPISGRLEAEKAHADARLRAAIDAVAEAEWRTRHDVRAAYIDWASIEQRLAETERLRGSLDGLVASTQELARSGEMTRTEAALFAIERAERAHDAIRLRGQLDEAAHRVRTLMGLAPHAPLELVASSATDGRQPDAGLGVDGHPSLARLRSEYDASEQALRVEIRRQYPDLTLGPIYESDQGQSRVGFTGGLPLPILNANTVGIARATAQREVARAAYETTYEQLASAMALAQSRAAALHQQRTALVERLAPMIDQQVADARHLLTIGEGGGLVLLESVVRAHQTRLDVLDIHREIALVNSTLRYLTGPSRSTEISP